MRESVEKKAYSAVRDLLRAVDHTIMVPAGRPARLRGLLDAAGGRLAALGRIRWEPVGSSCCGTAVAGHSDFDMMAVFLDPIRHGVGRCTLPYSIEAVKEALAADRPLPVPLPPGKAFDLFWECLRGLDAVPGFGAPERDEPAVRFPSLDGGPAVELVPGVEADVLWDEAAVRPSSGLVRVAFPATESRWLGTSPELHGATIDYSPGGADYTCHELIRLVKLLKYRHGVPLLSYAVELFVLRWLEGSHAYEAESIAEIVEQVGTGWRPRVRGGLADDVTELLADLASLLRSATAAGRVLTMLDLTTPELKGRVEVFRDLPTQVRAAERLTTVAAMAAEARARTRRDGAEEAVAHWRRLLG